MSSKEILIFLEYTQVSHFILDLSNIPVTLPTNMAAYCVVFFIFTSDVRGKNITHGFLQLCGSIEVFYSNISSVSLKENLSMKMIYICLSCLVYIYTCKYDYTRIASLCYVVYRYYCLFDIIS